jgi:hypothetical protein
VSVKGLQFFGTFQKQSEKPSKSPRCVPSCAHEKLIVSKRNQLQPRIRPNRILFSDRVVLTRQKCVTSVSDSCLAQARYIRVSTVEAKRRRTQHPTRLPHCSHRVRFRSRCRALPPSSFCCAATETRESSEDWSLFTCSLSWRW